MKKLYAIILGLALVLGLASIASAAATLTVTGEFEAIAGWNYTPGSGWEGLDYDAANLYIDLKAAMGDNATGELKVGFCEVDGGTAFINLAKFQYNITDAFYAGVFAAMRHDYVNNYRFYYRAVNGGEGFDHALGAHIYFDEFVNLFAGFKFDGGQVDLYTDLDPGNASWYVKGTFATDALGVTAWYANDDDNGTIFIGKVKYAFSDMISATGGVLSDNGDVYLGLWGNVGLEDVVSFAAYLEYDVSPFYNNDYWFLATLTMLGDFQPFLEWDETDGISIGWDYYLGASDFWGEYYFDGNEFDLGLDIVF